MADLVQAYFVGWPPKRIPPRHETDVLGNVRKMKYDDFGQMKAMILPNVAHPESGTLVRPRYEYMYNSFGSPVVVRDNILQLDNGTITILLVGN